MKHILDRRQFILTTTSLALLSRMGLGLAQGRGNRFYTLIVPQGPGGAVDLIARFFAENIQREAGVSIVVDNKPGAAGEIAASYVARLGPDRMTALIGNSSTMVVNSQVKKTRYDPISDFRALGGIVMVDTIFVVNTAYGFKTLDDVIRYARANPGKLAYASNGVGGAFHLAMEYFQALTETKMLHVPFNSAAQGEVALLSNQVALMIANSGPTMQHIRNGTMVPLAVVSSTPSLNFPSLIAASTVVPGFVANTWVGAYAPASIADEQAQELNRLFNQCLQGSGDSEFFQKQGLTPIPGSLDDASEWLHQEMRKWGEIIATVKTHGAIN